MTTEYPLSIEEEQALQQIGGFEDCRTVADAILRDHGYQRGLFSSSETKAIRKGRDGSSQERAITYHFDQGKSLRANIEDLLHQAEEVQADAGGTNHVGAMLQHLVGAKLDLVLGAGKMKHHGFSVADQSTERQGDYDVDGVAIHVTTNPTEALIRKCAANLQAGLKPVIVTIGDGVSGAAFLLKNSALAERVDVFDAGQFLTANVLERSLFRAASCKVTLTELLQRYNDIVATCETDPSLRIRLSGHTR